MLVTQSLWDDGSNKTLCVDQTPWQADEGS